ncbi:MAG: hypothetical protein PWQ57_396 [Desulfovibrionales bacterium]|jgi:aminoglycoside/choline kinase family phosphotransferase|nr:hypothetical protein [Desulfovibrionales bacterium]
MYSIDHLLKQHQDEIRMLRRDSALRWKQRKRQDRAMLNAFKERRREFAVPRDSSRFHTVSKLFGAMAAAVVAGMVILVG